MTLTPAAGDSAVERIALGFMDRTLPKPEWTHAAHWTATLWLLRHRPDLDLEHSLPPMIRAYNEATGVVNSDTAGYHETITIASIRAARAFLAEFPSNHPLADVVDRLMSSPLGDRDWLMAYWSKPRLFSPGARRRWLDPDLCSLPF